MELERNRPRLSVMMFGHYLIMGSWAVTLATFLMSSPLKGGLNFPPAYAGWIYSTLALAAIIVPIFTGLLADRLFNAEKLLGITHLLGAVLLVASAVWCLDQQPRIEEAYRTAAAAEQIDGVPILDLEKQHAASPSANSPESRKALQDAFQRVNDQAVLKQRVEAAFLPLFFLWFGYSLCSIFTNTLINVVAFRNLRDPKHSFGKVRMYGTVGWIVAGILLGTCLNPISPSPLFLAAAVSIVFGFFCFTLPNTPPSGQAKSLGEAFGLPALSLFRDGAFRVIIFCSLAMAAVQQFYVVYANRFLTELRMPHTAALQTIAQVSEVLCLMFFPYLIHRFGVKGTMMLGILGWIFRNGLFATCSLPAIIGIGLPLHGMSYAFFFLVASMYIDHKAPVHLRASAQGIFTFVAAGAGTLFGNWFSARIVESQTLGDGVVWTNVWLVPTIMSAAVLLVFWTMFRTPSAAESNSIVDEEETST